MAYYKVKNVIEALELRISQTPTQADGYEELKRTAKETARAFHDHIDANISGAVVRSASFSWSEPRIEVRLAGEQQETLIRLARDANAAEKALREYEYEWRQKQTRTMDVAELKGFLIVAKERDPEKAINTPMSVYKWLDPKILNKD